MGYNFLPYDQDQEHLMPKSLHDWVEDDSLEVFVSDLIDQFDAEGRLDPFYARYREDGWGHPAYHPRLLLKVIVFGYCHGIRSSTVTGSTGIVFGYCHGIVFGYCHGTTR